MKVNWKYLNLVLLICPLFVFGQIRNNDVYKLPKMGQNNVREQISIPAFDGYQVLKCDFHIHTVFSDGKVWPDMRVNEAWNQGLDAIAITDHIEYRPLKDVLKGDLNESYKIAKKHADELGFIVIQGTEVTRDKPIGHLNALFINDANALKVDDPVEALRIAKKQGAFIMWNHPGWPDDKSTLYPIHEQLIKEGLINGIEVFNYLEYYPVTFDYANKYNLSFMGNSDIHELITETYGNNKLARPLTLVFAKERSEKGIKEALFEGRSAVLFYGTLAGKSDILNKLLSASVKVRRLKTDGKSFEISNLSDIQYKFTVENIQYVLPANKTLRIELPDRGTITVDNCLTGKNTKLQIELPLAISE